jgi:hypothetical protein
MYKRNIEVRSCNHRCNERAVSIVYCVALVIGHAMRMRPIVMRPIVICPARLYYVFPHCLIIGTILEKKLLKTKYVF